MIEEKLKKLGFTANEMSVYLCLIKKGRLRAGEVIQESRLQRSVVYAALQKLLERELVSKTSERGVALYVAADPDALVYEAEQRKLLAQLVAEDLKKKRDAIPREALVYEGEDIIKRICDKNLEAQSESVVYFLGPSKFGIQSNLERYWQNYHKKRLQKGIACKILYDHDTDPHIVEERNRLALCEAKYLPFETQVPMWFNICVDTVGIVIPSESPPLAFLIRSPKSADALRTYFEYLWKQARQLSHEK